MRFICSWYNMDTEVKRDIVEAKDTNEASDKVYRLYPPGKPPAPCLAIFPMNGYHDSKSDINTYGW